VRPDARFGYLDKAFGSLEDVPVRQLEGAAEVAFWAHVRDALAGAAHP
jgi:hypothetical protein